MNESGPRFLVGWRVVGTVTVALLAMSIIIAGMDGYDSEGVHSVVRNTARTSLLLFLLAFTAAPLYALWPNAWTRWQRVNRRYLGVSFAASHFIHAIAILIFANMDPVQFNEGRTAISYVFGGLGYAFIIAMTATSFDRTAAWLGTKLWKLLHRVGIYYLLFQFTLSFGKRIGESPLYWIPVFLLIAAAGLRLFAWLMRKRVNGAKVEFA